MKLKKVLSLLLALVMTASLLTLPAHAEDAGAEETSTTAATVNFTDVAPFLPPVSGGVRMLRAPLAAPRAAANFAAKDTATDNGMKISKTATPNVDGSYTITLEAYATGSKVITEQKTDIPTDIILVLDQSGSMAWDMGSVSFGPYNNKKNSAHYANRHNGGNENLYYFDVNSKAYYPVSVEVVQTSTPKKLDSLKNYATSWGQITDGCYWYYRDNLYEKVGEEYKPVTLTRDWISTGLFSGYYRYTYTFSDGESIPSDGSDLTPTLGKHAPLYTLTVDENQNVYTYTYVDADGNTQTIGTSTGANNDFVTTLYQKVTSTNGGGSRLEALTTGVEAFANSVATKAAGKDGQLGTDDDVNHRIAVVGFASRSGNGNNTELLSIAGSNSGSVGVAYNSITNQNLKDVLQDMNTQPGQTMVTNAINALAANGATRVDLGMDMAQRILAANPVPNGQQRNRVVIVFTDGAPTSSNGFETDVANTAISTANTIKTGGATVYSVGIFPGANPTSSGTEPSWDLNDGSSSIPAASNWFMQNLSSNNGKVQTPSYYLSAADADTLKNIFQQISDQIESGGSSSTLTADAVVKDIISPQFTLPAGTQTDDITLETYKYQGPSFAADNAWVNNNDAMGAKATVNGDTVSVTGFDFAANYVGTVTENGNVSYRGNKLVIKFTVEPRDGFLGGNDVTTNASAGIYENSSAQTPVRTFDQPEVNVPIKDVTVTAKDKNVYLLGGLTAAQLKEGAMVKVGDVTLNLAPDATNYGLEAWQTEYVDITVTVKDEDGNAISDKLTDLTEDTTYTVEVTVAPKKPGTSTTEKGDAATAKTGVNDPAANIYVFKPELTFKDSTAYYGETVPTNNNYSGNQVGTEKWMHDGTAAVPSEMLGEKPTLDISFTPDESKLKDGKYTKQDVPVAATVKIGTENLNDYTTFVHQDCTTACGWETPAKPGAPAFLIHIQTCTLNITKQGGADNESYVFDVFKDGEKYSEVTIQGNGTETLVELPVGTYTIVEDSNWSWRYPNPTYSAENVDLSSTTPIGAITCTNAKATNSWLNGFSAVVRNIFSFGKN